MERTEKYFKKIKEEMGHIDSNGGWHGIVDILKKKGINTEVKKIAEYDGYINSSEIDIYTYSIDGKERFCAEFGYQVGIDDYCTETHIFRKLPSEDEVELLVEIESLEFKFKFKGLKPAFNCWECGKRTHWLDIPGSFEDKVNGLEDSYCGC